MNNASPVANRRVLITGAASGIGRAVALSSGAMGARLYLTDRNADGLADTEAAIRAAGGEVVMAEAFDVRDFAAVQQFAERVHADGIAMDTVMNIAGVAAWGTVDQLNHRQWQDMIDINLMGPIHVIETFLPPMIRAGRGGHLVNVASAAALLGLPWHAAYSASKFGLRGISEVLRTDLRPHHISVSLVCPGAVHTPLTGTVEIAGVDTSGERFRRMQAQFQRHAVSPERAARAILDGVAKRRYIIYTSNDIRLLYLLQRVAPPAYTSVMRVMHAVMRRTLPVTAS